jgi:hypothetical protein
VEQQHEGHWLAWDTEARQVLARDPDLEHVMAATEQHVADGRSIWYHHVVPREAIIVGGAVVPCILSRISTAVSGGLAWQSR